MQVEHILSEQIIANKWSKGTTSEIYIYPKESDFQKRNFQFRLSCATVDADETLFTEFIGIHRILMVLEGRLELNHNDSEFMILNPFEQTSFSGEWITKSRGRAKDFNFMMYRNNKGHILPHFLNENECLQLSLKENMSFIYLVHGQIKIENNFANSGDALVFSHYQNLQSLVVHCLSKGATFLFGDIEFLTN